MCTICQDTLLLGQDTKKLSCQHEFHRECFDAWCSKFVSRYATCPNCRATVRREYKFSNPPHFIIPFSNDINNRFSPLFYKLIGVIVVMSLFLFFGFYLY